MGPSHLTNVTLQSTIELFTAVVAPTAILSALMFYFGWVRARTLYGYFGVDISILQFNSTEYILRSAEVLFKPVIFATMFLAVMLGVSFLIELIERRAKKIVRYSVRGALLSLFLLTIALALRGFLPHRNPFLASISLAFSGTLILILHRVYLHKDKGKPQPIVVALA